MRAALAIVLATLVLGVASACGSTTTAGDAPTRLPAPTVSGPTVTTPSSATISATPSATPSVTPRPSAPPVPDITIPALSIPPMPGRGGSGPQAGADGLVEGGDASWPQCPQGMGIAQKRTEGKPMPLPTAQFVVLGLTNGPGFVANPCLADQVAWARARHLLVSAYSIISAPFGDQLTRYGRTGPFDAHTATGRLSNVGYQEALFNVATMRAAGLETPFVWLDVEPVTGFDWGSDTTANAAVVTGAARGYRDRGYGIGVYSIGSLWQRVVGGLRLGVPEWRPAGSRGRAEAVRRCGTGWRYQGGTAVLAQWVEDAPEGARDRDVTCPGQATYLSLWFHQY